MHDSQRLGGGVRTLGKALALALLTIGGAGCGGSQDEADGAVLKAQEALTGAGIARYSDLQNMSPGGSYYLLNDIDAAGQPAFRPIGDPFTPFTGTFDGNGHVIKNLRINGNGGWFTGMFSTTQGATIKNLGLTGVSVNGGGHTGALIGAGWDTTVTNFYVTGTVTANGGWVPGVGLAIGNILGVSTISRSYATGTVNGTAFTAGGFVGEYDGCGMTDFHTQGFREVFTNVNVSPSTNTGGLSVAAGGLIGQASGGWVEDISTVGPTNSTTYAGGVIGYWDNSTCSAGFTDILSRGNTSVVNASPARAGAIGGSDPQGSWFRCGAVIWDTTTDPGTPLTTPGCVQFGFDDNKLRAPHPDPVRPLIDPFYRGSLQTTYPYGGSDGEWGFGYTDPKVWALNSNTQHITLLFIPNPSVQPK